MPDKKTNIDKAKRLIAFEEAGAVAISKEFDRVDGRIDQTEETQHGIGVALGMLEINKADKEDINAIKLEIQNISLTPGPKGDDYVLTELDKMEIAESIKVPVVEQKIIEKTEVVREQPIIKTEIIKKITQDISGEEIITRINDNQTKKIKVEKIDGFDELNKKIEEGKKTLEKKITSLPIWQGVSEVRVKELIAQTPGSSPDLSGYVPYTGATGNVNLGSYNLTATNLYFPNGASIEAINSPISDLRLTTSTLLFDGLELNMQGASISNAVVDGYTPTSRTLTINGTAYDLSADRSWTVSASAGGSDTQVQFNDGGSFGGDSAFTWDKTNNILTLKSGTNSSLISPFAIQVPSSSSNFFQVSNIDNGGNSVSGRFTLSSPGTGQDASFVTMYSSVDGNNAGLLLVGINADASNDNGTGITGNNAFIRFGQNGTGVQPDNLLIYNDTDIIAKFTKDGNTEFIRPTGAYFMDMGGSTGAYTGYKVNGTRIGYIGDSNSVTGSGTDLAIRTESGKKLLFLTGGNNQRGQIGSDGAWLINGFGSSVVGLTVKGASSQSANLLEIQDSSANVAFAFTATGGLTIKSPAGSQSSLLFQDADVSHPFTSFTTASTYARYGAVGSSSGGAFFNGFTANTAASAMYYAGYSGQTSPSEPVIVFLAGKTDGGTGATILSSAQTEVHTAFLNQSGIKMVAIDGGHRIQLWTGGTNNHGMTSLSPDGLQGLLGGVGTNGGGLSIRGITSADQQAIYNQALMGVNSWTYGAIYNIVGEKSGTSATNIGSTDIHSEWANWDGSSLMKLMGGGGLIINESGNDSDTRIEGDTEPNLFFVDASADKIGIGTSSPAYKLDVTQLNAPAFLATRTTTALNNAALTSFVVRGETSLDAIDGFGAAFGFYFKDSAGTDFDLAYLSAYRDGSDSSGAFAIRNYNGGVLNENLTIKANRKIGFGNTAPSANFDFQIAASSFVGMAIRGAASQSADLQQWQNSSGTALAVMDESGNFGIGNSNPQRKFHLTINDSTADGASCFELENIASGGGTWFFHSGATGSTIGAGAFGIGNASDYCLSINNDKYVKVHYRLGVGISAPTRPIHVYVSDSTAHGAGMMLLQNTASGGNSWYLHSQATGGYQGAGSFAISDNTDYRFVITSNGTVKINSEGYSTADFQVFGDTDANLLFVDASADKVGVGTSSPGSKLDVAGSFQCDSITNDTGLAHGTYTPTLTQIANLDGAQEYECQYMRVGNTVTVSGKIDLEPADVLLTRVGISLPVSSNLADEQDCAGTANSLDTAGNHAIIKGDGTNNRAELAFNAPAAGTATFFFTFTYQVI